MKTLARSLLFVSATAVAASPAWAQDEPAQPAPSAPSAPAQGSSAQPADRAPAKPAPSEPAEAKQTRTVETRGADAEAEVWVMDDGEEMLFLPGEVVEVYGERPTKPFDRDTKLRLTGKELAKRGVTNLGQALELVPELQVRRSGRGGVQVNVRGARKAGVRILIDGVPVDEVYYGTFDISSIPVTDIAQIRVSTSPSSPIDGVGGPGGVIEVHTIDAAGGGLVRARAEGSDLPSADVSATGRTNLGAGFSARGSVAATVGMQEFDMANGADSIDESRENVNGAVRLEWRRGESRVVADAFAQARSYVVPPGTEGMPDILVIDEEISTRAGLQADVDAGAVRVQARAYGQTLSRKSARYRDPSLTDPRSTEDLSGDRFGGAVLVSRPESYRFNYVGSFTLDTESADVSTAFSTSGGRSTMGEAAAGAQFEEGDWAIDGAVGLGIPIGVGENPWPEAKLAVTWNPVDALSLKVIGARKGRLPTLRERFRTDIGNDELSPELSTFGELEVTLEPHDRVEIKVGTYVRDTDGQIRFLGDENRLVNIDNLVVRGVDTALVVRPTDRFTVGAHWNFLDSDSPLLGTNSLDFLPQDRAELWVAGELGRFGGRARVRYTGEQLDRNEILDSFTTFDFSAYARIHRTLNATLRVDNLTDRRYEFRSGGVMAPGRVVYLSLQSNWE